MAAQLGRRHELLDAGDRRAGWKLGITVRPAQEAMGLAGPVLGFLTEATVIASGDRFSLEGGARIGVEPEVAVHLGADVEPGGDRDAAAAAIAALGPALEVVDVDRPLEADQLEPILAGNVFHRAVAFGPATPHRAGGSLEGVTARVLHNHQGLDPVEAAAVAGDLPAVVRMVADQLGALGERLRAGDRIITGSLTPPIWVEPGDEVGLDLAPLGPVELGFD